MIVTKILVVNCAKLINWANRSCIYKNKCSKVYREDRILQFECRCFYRYAPHNDVSVNEESIYEKNGRDLKPL